MYFRHHQPHPALRHFVNRIVVSRFSFDNGGQEVVIPFPPQPEHCLYFYPQYKISTRLVGSDDFTPMPQSMIVGPHLTRVDIRMAHANTMVILVGFQPGGLHRLLRLPMHELLDKPMDASLMLGKDIDLVTGQLSETNDEEKLVEIVQQYLLQRSQHLKPLLPVEKVLIEILQQQRILNVDQLAREAFVSVRQLERQFKERTGLSPKIFSRLMRFSQAWLLRERRAGMSWTSIAHTCGYADQAHMIRDFKEFAGVSPGVLHACSEQSPVLIQGNTFL